MSCIASRYIYLVYISAFFLEFIFIFYVQQSKQRCAATRLSEINFIFLLCTRAISSRKSTEHTGYRYVCVWKIQNGYALMHSTFGTELSDKRTRKIHQPQNVVIVECCFVSCAPFFSLSLLCLWTIPHIERTNTRLIVCLFVCLFLFAISFIHDHTYCTAWL